jgi:hypothetical protein
LAIKEATVDRKKLRSYLNNHLVTKPCALAAQQDFAGNHPEQLQGCAYAASTANT